MKLALIIALFSITVVSASQSATELFQKCAVCHGEHGEKHSLNVTKYIAGMDEDDLVDILQEYKEKTRNKYGLGTMMQGQAANLTEEDMKTLATYISNFPPVKIVEKEEVNTEDLLDGSKIFKRCAVCHGDKADKRSLNVSKYIAGMKKDDIIELLHTYQAGKINQYGFGNMMKGQVNKISEEQLEAVAAYIESLPVKPEDSDVVKSKQTPKKSKKSADIDFNKFMKEHFENSTNPNETFAAGKKKWEELQEQKNKEDNSSN